MKERPILFSTPMVQAILEGRKTMTRRVVKPQPDPVEYPGIPNATVVNIRGKTYWFNCQPEHPNHITKACPYGLVGDRLWVRETWCRMEMLDDGLDRIPDSERIYYKADNCDPFDGQYRNSDLGQVDKCSWKPSIHMPRAASRITLEITGIRVERLKEITGEEAIKEGFSNSPLPDGLDGGRKMRDLWDYLNTKRGYSWDSNPWVWVIEFKNISEEVR